MDETTLIKLLKDHFPTKMEFDESQNNLGNFRREVLNEFQVINEKLDELKSSTNVLDKVLEHNPIERIDRLEKHSNLPPFVYTVEE